MKTETNNRSALETLDARLKTLLPEEYRDSYEDVQPSSMGSAALKYDADGQVAWDEMWGSFCDLAMAGGPPHKGTLLEPGNEADIDAQFGRYDAAAEEICRGIRMVTGLRSYISPTPGWVSRDVSTATRWPAGCFARSSWRTSRRAAGAPILELPACAALPAREGNQERHHRHREDLPLLAGPHAARAAAGDRRALRDDGRGIAAARARPVESRGGPRSRARATVGGADSAGHRPSRSNHRYPGLARRRVPERSCRGVDDARAGREQRAVAAGRDVALRAN